MTLEFADMTKGLRMKNPIPCLVVSFCVVIVIVVIVVVVVVVIVELNYCPLVDTSKASRKTMVADTMANE